MGRFFLEHARIGTVVRPKVMASACLTLLRSIVFISNLLIWLAGLTLLGLGIGLRIEPTLIQYLKQHEVTDYSLIEVVSYVIIIAGACLTIVGFLGCCGAWFLSQGMLVMYFLILMVALGLEITAAVLVHLNRDQYKLTLEREMNSMVQKGYTTDPKKAALVDEIQSSFQCCGVKSYNDWLHSTFSSKNADSYEIGVGALKFGRVPKSCCNAHGLAVYSEECGRGFDKEVLNKYTQFLNTQGCGEKFFNLIDKEANTIIIVCVSIAVLQLLGMFFSMMLCCITSAEEDRKIRYY